MTQGDAIVGAKSSRPIEVCGLGGIPQNPRRWVYVSLVTNGFVGKEPERRGFRNKKGFEILKKS